MRKVVPCIKPFLAGLLLLVSVTAALWDFEFGVPEDGWSKVRSVRSPDGKTTGYQMMVYVDRPIVRSDQTCRTYLRIRNAGKHPLELRSTYLTNHHYENGELFGEEIGDWSLPGSPVKLSPGEVKDVLYAGAISIGHPKRICYVGTRGFQFRGFGLETNTATVYVLPSRPFWLVLALVGALALRRTTRRTGRSGS